MRSLARASALISLFGLLGWGAFGTSTLAQAQLLQHEGDSQNLRCAARLESGQLTVIADRCSLKEVVDAIRGATGAKVEWVGQDVEDVGTVLSGPGAPDKVISSVLYGSPWNFIIISDLSGSITEIMLTRRPPVYKPPSSAVLAVLPANNQTAKQGSDVDAKQVSANVPTVYQPYPVVVTGNTSDGNSVQAKTAAAVYGPSTGNVVQGALEVPAGSPKSVAPAASTEASSKPALPPNIPPEIWNIYPPNLMQLITSPKPPVPTPPAPSIPPGQVILINPILPAKPP